MRRGQERLLWRRHAQEGWFEGSAQASEVALALGEGCNIRFVDYEAEVQPPASSEKRSFARIVLFLLLLSLSLSLPMICPSRILKSSP